jgi:hypothetical protein
MVSYEKVRMRSIFMNPNPSPGVKISMPEKRLTSCSYKLFSKIYRKAVLKIVKMCECLNLIRSSLNRAKIVTALK